jgi:hypothetical protein
MNATAIAAVAFGVFARHSACTFQAGFLGFQFGVGSALGLRPNNGEIKDVD